MSRRAYLWAVGVALVAGALLLTDWLLWTPGLTEDNVRRIKPGMTLAEVEEMLGGPAPTPSRCPPTGRRTAGVASGGTEAPGPKCSSPRTGA
jgi:hypothetical protein